MLTRHRSLSLVIAAFATLAFVSVPSAAGQARPAQTPRDIRGMASPSPSGTGIISGSVVIAGAGHPARRARVNLSANEGRPREATTDDMGRFTFSGLPAGRFTLSATKPGYISVTYGQTRPGRPGTPIELADGQKFDAQLTMVRGGVVTGTILDEHGEAIPGTQVRALRYVLQNGVRTLQPSGNGATDDRGIYHVYGLQPGDYIVAATPRNSGAAMEVDRLQAEVAAMRERADRLAREDDAQARALLERAALLQTQITPSDEPVAGYAAVYYPGTTTPAEASAVTVGPGEEKGAVDFQLQRVPVARIEGTVVNPGGQPTQNLQVLLVNTGFPVPGLDRPSARPDAEGRFRIANVPSGQYAIIARAMVSRGPQGEGTAGPAGRPPAPAEQPRLWSTADVTVDGRNLSNIVLSLQPGGTLSGRVAFEGATAQPADVSRIRVTATPADLSTNREIMGPASGRVDAAGRFTIAGMVPGRYRISASAAGPGWFLESAVIDGQDTLDFPVELKNQNVTGMVITFTDRQTELTGSIVDQHGQPAPAYTVVVYPADQRFWTPQARRIQSTRPATDGRFTFRTLPPGDYRIAPVIDPEPGVWYDAAYLQELDATALRVSIAAGEKKVQNLRISGGDRGTPR
jgi:hypothetical protein